MATNSRGFLLLGASLLVVAFAGMSTVKGSGWILPMATLLSGILFILIFTFMTISEDSKKGSTPTSNSSGSKQDHVDSEVENLPDPRDSGFELPIL